MATTTPNFGWVVPTSTDLVKNGATAIETLGDSIDASMAELKGGTTGQVLSKTSNTDMDFTWIANDTGDITGVTAGTGISGGGTSGTVTVTNSMATAIDAKGDLIAGTGADAFSRLAIGTNNQILTADSAEATGMKWATPAVVPSGLTLIQTTSTGGAVTAINFGSNASPIFSSTYDNYRIQFVGTASGGLNPQIRMRADTTNATGANYNDQYINVTGTNVSAARTTGASSAGLPPLDTARGSFVIDMYSPFIAATTTWSATGTSPISTISFQTWIGQHVVSTSYNGFGILTGSASTIDGTFYIYGLAK